MRIIGLETLHADGGWRVVSFLKLTTDAGLVGWAEFNETTWNPGLTPTIQSLAPLVAGRDPRAFGRLSAELLAATQMVAGGLARQAVAAIENACIDLAAKAAGVPAYRLFGGPYRERIPVYWSHCGTFRATRPEVFETLVGAPPLRTLEGFVALGREVRAKGYRALKTNPIVFGADGARLPNPGFVPGPQLDLAGAGRDFPVAAVRDQIAALREGAGPDVALLLDLNFSLKGEGLLRIGRALDDLGLAWLEVDVHDAAALAEARARLQTPIASYESLHGVAQYRPFIEARAADFALIDVVWNGLNESVRIAAFAGAHTTTVAPHNYYGQLATRISAHFCAAVPNCRIMELEVDDVPWHRDLVTAPVRIEDGELWLDDAPGWGCEVDEAALRAHPAPRDPARPWLH